MKREGFWVLTSVALLGLAFVVTTPLLLRTSLGPVAAVSSPRSITYDADHNRPQDAWLRECSYDASENITGGNVGSYGSTEFEYHSSDGSSILSGDSGMGFLGLMSHTSSKENPGTYTVQFEFFAHNLQSFSVRYKNLTQSATENFDLYGFLGHRGASTLEKNWGDISTGHEATWDWAYSKGDGEVDDLIFKFQTSGSILSSSISCSILSMTLTWIC